jgi:hypothetical protein
VDTLANGLNPGFCATAICSGCPLRWKRGRGIEDKRTSMHTEATLPTHVEPTVQWSFALLLGIWEKGMPNTCEMVPETLGADDSLSSSAVS